MRFKTFSNFRTQNSKLKGYLKWWARHTAKENRMLTRTPAYFRENLLFAVFIFENETLVAAAGLIPCLNRHKEHMYHKGKLVVELASNFVHPDYRDSRYGTFLVEKRLEYCKKNNYFPVSVTGSVQIQKIFSHLAIQMGKVKKLDKIRKEVRVCECTEKERPCKICPLADRAIWAFPTFY
jgi:GNAT superfamily N-acetyltransferase